MLSISVDGTCPIHATTLPNNLSSPHRYRHHQPVCPNYRRLNDLAPITIISTLTQSPSLVPISHIMYPWETKLGSRIILPSTSASKRWIGGTKDSGKTQRMRKSL